MAKRDRGWPPKRVNALRRALELDLADFARALNVSTSTAARWEDVDGLGTQYSAPACGSHGGPSGLAAEVLRGLELALVEAASDPDQLARIRGRVSLGIGALLAYGLLSLTNRGA